MNLVRAFLLAYGLDTDCEESAEQLSVLVHASKGLGYAWVLGCLATEVAATSAATYGMLRRLRNSLKPTGSCPCPGRLEKWKRGQLRLASPSYG